MARQKHNQPAEETAGNPTDVGPKGGDITPTPAPVNPIHPSQAAPGQSTPAGPVVGDAVSTTVPVSTPNDGGRFDPSTATGSADPVGKTKTPPDMEPGAGTADNANPQTIPPKRKVFNRNVNPVVVDDEGEPRPAAKSKRDDELTDVNFSRGVTRSDTPRKFGTLARRQRIMVAGMAQPGVGGPGEIEGDGGDMTLNEVAGLIRQFSAALRAGNVWDAFQIGGQIVMALAAAGADQFLPIAAAGPGEREAVAQQQRDFDSACQEFDEVRSMAVGAAPQLAAGNRGFTGFGPATTGTDAPLAAEAAGVQLAPGDLLAMLQMVSQAIELFRKLFRKQ